jgi:ABC-type sugar transport system substrate-binding protein
MANLLVAHSNINVVAADGDQDIEGAIVALKARGKVTGTTGSDVRLIGLGASQASVAGIRAGTWFGTALSLPYTEGQLAAQYIIQAVRGTLKAPIGVSAALSSGINPEVSKATLPSTFKAQWIG